MSVRPLPIYPHKPTGQVLDMLKQAKDRLNLDYMIQPVEAVPGSPGRILCIGEKLPWLQDHAVVGTHTVDKFEAALKYVLELNDDPRGVTVLRQLKEVFGDGVREVID